MPIYKHKQVLNMINNIIKMIFIMSLISCSNYPKETMGIIVFDNMYACDSTLYKIHEVIDIKSQQEIDYKYGTDANKKLFEISKQIEEQGIKTDDELIGKDISIEFRNMQLEKEFDIDVGSSPICYIYYFEGAFMDKDTFLIDKYKIFEKVPNCKGVLP